ncbi:Sec-independent protein translocase protein TatB [Geminicoccus roseus]|uniref:Sec-independent protein translocase protein TatB n=1 Tax=Geminicoccus roseus TaxID=404900 RepID=UPI000556ACA0|nr:Sec-independent protein translocase protein TatB [Geminicoccus roseus]
MFDLAWSEMAIIMVVVLVVVGPKDLPRLARTLGQWVAKGRSMAREFQRHIDDMAREADLQDLKDSVQKISPAGVRDHITKTIDPDGTLGKSLDHREIAKSLEPAPAKPAAAPAPAAAETAAAPAVPAAEGPAPAPVASQAAAAPSATTGPSPAESAPKPTPAPAEKA